MENTNENAIPTVIEREKIIEREVMVDKIVTEIVEVEKEVVREIPSALGNFKANSIAESLANFNLEMENISKNAKNPFFRSNYLDLSGISKIVRPILAKHDLSIIQYPVNDSEGRVAVNTILLHRNGEKLEFPGVFVKPSKMGDAQVIGSLIQYLKRYQVSAILFVAAKESPEEDDGNAASGKVTIPQQTATPTQQTTTPSAPTPRIGRI